MHAAPHPTAYTRPKSGFALSKIERETLLKEYFDYYRNIATTHPELLNQKLPREISVDLLQQIGSLLLKRTGDLARESGPVKDFLDRNTLPPSLSSLLPPDFRAFCLALNALKQWVSAEQQATDRYLLGGKARDELRRIAGSCIVTGKDLDGDCELHHPVRDGRPPIPLCRETHERVEQQGAKENPSQNPVFAVMLEIRRQKNNSWKNLRRGCLELLGEHVEHSTKAVGASSRAFARKVAVTTGLNFAKVIQLLDEHGLGLL